MLGVPLEKADKTDLHKNRREKNQPLRLFCYRFQNTLAKVKTRIIQKTKLIQIFKEFRKRITSYETANISGCIVISASESGKYDEDNEQQNI